MVSELLPDFVSRDWELLVASTANDVALCATAAEVVLNVNVEV